MTIVNTANGIENFDAARLSQSIERAASVLSVIDVQGFTRRVLDAVTSREEVTPDEIVNTMILKALDEISIETPQYTHLASQFHLRKLYKEAGRNRGYNPDVLSYGSLAGLIRDLTDKGIYNKNILETFSQDEIHELSQYINPEKDNEYSYISLRTLSDRYLATDHNDNVFELPQERNMIIAMALMLKEEGHDDLSRINLAKEAYWALSNRLMTMATPTLSNAGKSYGQYSSCFIDTVEDSIEGIYNSNTDVARLSKEGGGIGVYIGHVRGKGSWIKGFKGRSSGKIPWVKQYNNTAVSVDQLGKRQGALALYDDVFDIDIEDFLDLKLNNGDERRRAHDIFTGVCIPDLFMERLREVDENGKSIGRWFLFDPYETKNVMGWYLSDSYDEERGKGTFRDRYDLCVTAFKAGKLKLVKEVRAMDIMARILKSQLESGVPYMFYRDTVNRANPNKHLGMIYCSNLCTEIMQNTSATTVISETLEDEDGQTVIVTRKKPGDFVVCNLASLSLAKAWRQGKQTFRRLIRIIIRMLDNVIDLNNLQVLQAQATNKKYRSIGLGGFGWAHLLAVMGIKWESEEAIAFCDEVYEEIAFNAIEMSKDLAIEKGKCKASEGSEWETGEYFVRRGYVTRDASGTIKPIYMQERWYYLCLDVMKHGVRNANIQAPAPNSSTAKIGDSTDGVDAIFKKFYSEEKKDYKIPVTAPELNQETFWYYKSAFEIDQSYSIRQNAARQRHVDQSISFNLYVKNTITGRELYNHHDQAWDVGLKTTYYVRSQSNEDMIEECESCSS